MEANDIDLFYGYRQLAFAVLKKAKLDWFNHRITLEGILGFIDSPSFELFYSVVSPDIDIEAGRNHFRKGLCDLKCKETSS